MSKATGTAATRYRVEQYDSPLRFHVTSGSRHNVKHLVELDDFRGNGSCSCENFCFRHKPELEKGAAPDVIHRCQHILQAREFFTDHMLARIADAQAAAAQKLAEARARIEEAKRLGYDPQPEDLQLCQ